MAKNVHQTENQSEPSGTEGSSQLPGGWTRHSPKGGLTIGGQYFKGGQFIPEADLDNASPQELANLNKAIQESERNNNKSGADKLAKEQQNVNPTQEAPVNQNVEKITENVYIIGDGKLISDSAFTLYGSVILKNNVEGFPNFTGADLNICHVLNTKRFDLISSVEITSLRKEDGKWPVTSKDFDVNIMDEIVSITKVEKIPLEVYAPINLLPEQLKSVFVQNQPKNVPPPPPIEGAAVNMSKRHLLAEFMVKLTDTDTDKNFVKDVVLGNTDHSSTKWQEMPFPEEVPSELALFQESDPYKSVYKNQLDDPQTIANQLDSIKTNFSEEKLTSILAEMKFTEEEIKDIISIILKRLSGTERVLKMSLLRDIQKEALKQQKDEQEQLIKAGEKKPPEDLRLIEIENTQAAKNASKRSIDASEILYKLRKQRNLNNVRPI